MLKIGSYILSIIIFTQALGLSPKTFVNLDDIWSHYKMHQEEYGDDFMTFIDLHYGSGKAEHQDEHQEHEQLPCLNCNLFQNQILILTVLDFNLIEVETPIHKNLNSFYSDNYFSTVIIEVFQPPKNFDWS
mgnify:FL=1